MTTRIPTWRRKTSACVGPAAAATTKTARHSWAVSVCCTTAPSALDVKRWLQEMHRWRHVDWTAERHWTHGVMTLQPRPHADTHLTPVHSVLSGQCGHGPNRTTLNTVSTMLTHTYLITVVQPMLSYTWQQYAHYTQNNADITTDRSTPNAVNIDLTRPFLMLLA